MLNSNRFFQAKPSESNEICKLGYIDFTHSQGNAESKVFIVDSSINMTNEDRIAFVVWRYADESDCFQILKLDEFKQTIKHNLYDLNENLDFDFYFHLNDYFIRTLAFDSYDKSQYKYWYHHVLECLKRISEEFWDKECTDTPIIILSRESGYRINEFESDKPTVTIGTFSFTSYDNAIDMRFGIKTKTVLVPCIIKNGNSVFSDKTSESNFDEKDLLSLDNIRAELPILSQSFLSNASSGLIDLYWPNGVSADQNYYTEIILKNKLLARDPWELIKKGSSVAIDFGTSSTVVATKDNTDQVQLIKISYNSGKTKYNQYENPTVLRFVNYDKFLKDWQSVPYKPLTHFADLKCSHVAKNENISAQRNTLKSIKSWCRSDYADKTINLVDEQNKIFNLKKPALIESEEGVGDFVQRPLDPIEVYAYYLGLSLNTQSLRNGEIYLNYYMSFPIKFDQKTKAIILQGFKRGLLRSLPPSLIYSDKWKEKSLFSLKEVASEPVALAAACLEELNIHPSDKGNPFAIFDFGGGTSDFAVGLYRTPTEEEQNKYDWEQILDIIEVSGDNDLGGEHLCDLIVYEVIKDNLEGILDAGIKYYLPDGFKLFPNSETLFSDSSYAYQNTDSLRESLRPIWEFGFMLHLADNSKITDEQIDLPVSCYQEDGNTKELNFEVNQLRIQRVLISRIISGLERLLSTIKLTQDLTKGDNNLDLSSFDVVFSGNSFKSPLSIYAIFKWLQDIKLDNLNLNPHLELILSDETVLDSFKFFLEYIVLKQKDSRFGIFSTVLLETIFKKENK